jgi:hypothetical protein
MALMISEYDTRDSYRGSCFAADVFKVQLSRGFKRPAGCGLSRARSQANRVTAAQRLFDHLIWERSDLNLYQRANTG